MLLLLAIFHQIRPYKYGFNLYKGFFLWKKRPKFAKFWRIFIFKLPNFYDKFQQVGKNTEWFSFFSTFISSMQPNLAKLFSEWLPLWLHHKILKRNPAWYQEPSGISKTWTQNNTGIYIYIYANSSQSKKTEFDSLALGPGGFLKTIRPVWKLACGSKESKKGGQRTYPNLLALFRFFLGNPEVLWGVWNSLELVGSLILNFKYPE